MKIIKIILLSFCSIYFILTATILFYSIAPRFAYFITPWNPVDFPDGPIDKVIYRESGSSEDHLLTDNKEEIDALLYDVESQWVGTIREAPTNEISYSIEFSNEKSGGADLIFTYFPQSDAMLFYSSYDFPNEIISLKSSEVLKQLLSKRDKIAFPD